MRWSGMLTACLIIAGTTVSGCVSASDLQPFDASRVRLLQTEPLMEGEDLAVISTADGEIRMRFFPSEAPQAVQNFKALVREGFYDGKELIGPQNLMKHDARVLLSGGVKTGTLTGVSRVNGDRPFKKEISANLWHFTGAVSVLGNKNDRGDSRFFITGTQAVSEEVLEELEETQYPPAVVNMFREKGGEPAFSLDYSIFAQVVSGQDVVDRLIVRVLEEERPALIETVTLVVYQGDSKEETAASPAGSLLIG